MAISVAVAGLPHSISKVKLKVLIEKHTGSGTVDKVQKTNDHVVLIFKDEEGLQKFHDAQITEVEFGQKKYPLKILKQDQRTAHLPTPLPQSMFSRNPEQPSSSNAQPDSTTPSPRPEPQLQVAQKTLKINDKLQEKLYRNQHYWSSLADLPATGGTTCVLAQCIDPGTHIQKILMHFESKKRANGGPVACVVTMIDGLLIVFQDPSDCKSCLEMRQQKIADQDLIIYSKKIPEYYDRKFVIEGVAAKTEQDTLIMFLESCTKQETAPKSCLKQQIPGVYLIEYEKTCTWMDTSEKTKFLQNIQMQPLEGHKLKARPVLKTDCLKVGGIPKDVSNDQIKLSFESKKRTDGGPVTRIDRIENNSALVYFALYEDAERIYERSKASDGSVIISQHPVTVELYHHSLATDHENVIQNFQPTPSPKSAAPKDGKNHQLQPFQLEPKCDEKLLEFIFGNTKHLDILATVFERFAAVEVVRSPRQDEPKLVKFTPRKVLSSMSQEEFENKCKVNFENHFSKYSKCTQSFDRTKLQKVRSLKLYPQIEETYTWNGNNDDLTLSWKPDEATVEVIGIKASVDLILQQIATYVSSTVCTRPFSESQFGVLQNCGIISDLRKKHERLQIKDDSNDFSVTFIGPESDVNAAQIDALSAVMIDKKKLSGLNEVVLKFLSESMQKSTEIALEIQKKWKKNGVKATIELDDGEPYLKPKTDQDFKKAVEVIKQFITVDVIRTDEAKTNVIKSLEWTNFHKTLDNSGLYKFYVKPGESITLVGTFSEVKVIRAKIRTFLDENSIKRFFINMEYGRARFVVERSPEFTPEMCERKEIKCGLSPEANGGVYVEGKTKALNIAHPEVKKLLEEIIEVQQVLEKPGIKEYYSSEDGKQFLANTERINNCIILTGSRQIPEWVEYNRKNASSAKPQKSKSSSVDFKEEELLSVTLPSTSVGISVWKTDIIKHTCDVIVNASNPELTLLPGGVSGVIKTLDAQYGNQIQKEMTEFIKRNYGNILPGEAVITCAGNLRACKKIVHAVGPRWHSQSRGADPSLVLKACISKSLGLVEKAGLKSIAIPAISCGVFGGLVPVCIPLIVETVEEYFKEIRNSCIKKVHFVENSNQGVLDEFVKYLKKYKSRKLTPPPSQQQAFAQAGASSSPSSSSSLQQGSCTVNLVQGDIAAQKADVIVNVTDPAHLRSMVNGPVISKVLVQSAGQQVEQECIRLPGPYNLGSVFETSAGGLSCRKLYHALVTHYDAQNSPSIIQAVVSNSLKMADKSGFRSITFPAIATGGFKHPPQMVAKLMRQEIINFPATNLRDVTILLYPQNLAAIKAFEIEFNSKNPPTPSTPTPSSRFSFTPHRAPAYSSSPPTTKSKEKPKKKNAKSTFQKIDDSSVSFGQLIASIRQGDITNQECDVIVNSTNQRFTLNQGMVSTQILKKGGRQIQDEAFEAGALKKGADYIVTTAGSLPCQKIIHLVTPENPKDLQKKIVKLLQEVEKLKLRSVCMPAFGTGMLSMDIESVGSVMQDAIKQFAKSYKNLRHLEYVTIVIYDEKILKSFKNGFFNPKKGLLERLFGWGGSVMDYILTSAPQEEEQEELEEIAPIPTALNLYFYSTSEEHIDQAVQFITDEARKVLHRVVIEDSVISRITDWEKHDIIESGKKHNVHITDNSNRYLVRLVLEGITKEVIKAHEEIKDILREFSAAETCASFVTWQKKNPDGKWVNYHLRSANVLEQAHRARMSTSRGSAPSKVQVPEFDLDKVIEHTVDLSLLDGGQQGKSPQVKRSTKERGVNDIPDFWDDMQGKQLVIVPIQPGSQEYQNVLAKFQTTTAVFHQSIVSIERIQNLSLYKQYVAKRGEVTEKLKNFGGQVERHLFHGTSDDEQILLHGFDRSYAGKNNILYGRGVYFATDPGFSHGYALPDAQGHRKMFLADVITGEFCLGNSGMVAPPQRTNSPIKNDLFDSTVNNGTNPTIFVIFKDASSYPAYRITYT